jgi:hypothetical protein
LVGLKSYLVVFKSRPVRNKVLRLVNIEINVFGLESDVYTFGPEVPVGDFVFFYQFDYIDLILGCLDDLVGFVAGEVAGKDVVPGDFHFVQILFGCYH